jgi:hypothetical protein
VRVINSLFSTSPIAIHGQGSHSLKPHWEPICAAFFATPRRILAPSPELTVITCNNGHPSLGLMESSLEHLGLKAKVVGQDVAEWRNSFHKPPSIAQALGEIDTPYTLFADSRDVILLDDPAILLDRFKAFGARMVFSADRMHWPPCIEFKRFERSIAPAGEGDFFYLNGGLWIGETDYCRGFFDAACRTEPDPSAPDSEQGILRKLFPAYYPAMTLDYRCSMFQNVGFVYNSILSIES